jgi:hypothetical protein
MNTRQIAKQIIASVLAENLETKVPDGIATQFLMMGDPFHEDEETLMKKYRILWGTVVKKFDTFWRMALFGLLSVETSPETNLTAVKKYFRPMVYDYYFRLITAAGLPPLNDVEYHLFASIVELINDDTADYMNMATT